MAHERLVLVPFVAKLVTTMPKANKSIRKNSKNEEL